MSKKEPRRRPGRPTFDEIGEGERRERILQVATDLFEHRGYAAVSIGDIAAQVGVTKAAIYHHFPSKDTLFTAATCRVLGLIGGAIQQTASGPGPVSEKIRQLAELAILFVPPDADADSLLRDANEHLSSAQQQEIHEAQEIVLGALEALMREGIARDEFRPHTPRLLAHAFWQLMGGFGGRRGAQAGFQGRSDVARAMADLFLHGVRISIPSTPL